MIARCADWVVAQVADEIKKCKTPDDIRDRFNIRQDYTPEEVEEVKKAHPWIYDKVSNSPNLPTSLESLALGSTALTASRLRPPARPSLLPSPPLEGW